jgi:hypothetical protein
MVFEGRELEPGDVVLLSEYQAHAWRDRFRLIEDQRDEQLVEQAS